MPITPKHLAEILDISWHRFVRWRAHLGDLAELKGREVEYFTAEALALMVLFELAEKRGIRPARLTPLFPRLVEVCDPDHWAALAPKKLLLNEKTLTVRAVSSAKEIEPDEEFWVHPLVPMGPLIDRMLKWWHRRRPQLVDAGQTASEAPARLVYLVDDTAMASLRAGDREWTLFYKPVDDSGDRCSEAELRRRASEVLRNAEMSV